jgi:hypothetical protein
VSLALRLNWDDEKGQLKIIKLRAIYFPKYLSRIKLTIRLLEDFVMHHKERGRDGVEWIHLAKDRDKLWALVKTVMNFRVQ